MLFIQLKIYCRPFCICAYRLTPFILLFFLVIRWGEINKIASVRLSFPTFSHPLAPCSVNNDFVTAEITYSTARVHHKVLTWSWASLCSTLIHGLLCVVHLYGHHLGRFCCCIRATLEWHQGYVMWGYSIATLWLCYDCCYSCCISKERGCVMSAMPARRE